jgi:hypothetical protein
MEYNHKLKDLVSKVANMEESKVIRSKKFHKILKLEMPYGFWIVCDGKVIMFNRKYVPICVQPESERCFKDPHGFYVDFVERVYFYSDNSSPWRSTKFLKEYLTKLSQL